MNWKDYEQEIHKYFTVSFPETSIKYDQKIFGKYSKVERQIDILIEGNIAGFALKIIVDCKYFSKTIDVKEVETFCSMVEDVDANQGVLITKKGFSYAAINRAYYGPQKVELDIINFDKIKAFQGFEALPYIGNFMVSILAPFGWVIDIKDKINPVATLYQRGLTLKQAQKKKEWMYLEFWGLDKNKSFSIDKLINLQNKNILQLYSKASFEYNTDLIRKDNYQTKIRIADVNTYPCLEVTGFIKFEDYIFFAVLFTPKELLRKNLRKLQYLLSTCKPGKIEYDNLGLINQMLNEIEKTGSRADKSIKYHQIGDWYSEMDDYQNAIINYRKSLDLFPTHYGFLNHIIDLELRHGEIAEALKYSADLLMIKPNYCAAPIKLIEIFVKNGKAKILNKFFVAKIKEYDDNEIKGNLFFHLGVLQLNMNQNEKARKSFLISNNFFKKSLPKDHQVFKTIKEALLDIKNNKYPSE